MCDGGVVGGASNLFRGAMWLSFRLYLRLWLVPEAEFAFAFLRSMLHVNAVRRNYRNLLWFPGQVGNCFCMT